MKRYSSRITSLLFGVPTSMTKEVYLTPSASRVQAPLERGKRNRLKMVVHPFRGACSTPARERDPFNARSARHADRQFMTEGQFMRLVAIHAPIGAFHLPKASIIAKPHHFPHPLRHSDRSAIARSGRIPLSLRELFRSLRRALGTYCRFPSGVSQRRKVRRRFGHRKCYVMHLLVVHRYKRRTVSFIIVMNSTVEYPLRGH